MVLPVKVSSPEARSRAEFGASEGRLASLKGGGDGLGMARSTLGLGSSIESYLNAHSSESAVMAELREVTSKLPLAMMQIAPSQGAFMSWLVRLTGAQKTIEVGVFTGASTLLTAAALPEGGRILACDVNAEWTDIAKTYWRRAGLEHKIELVLRPAVETLHERLLAGEANHYDFAFIDADKPSYPEYYELCLRLVRRGGIILLDNMLWGGSVAERSSQSKATQVLRELNHRILHDARVECSLVPVGDGLMLVRKL